MGRQEVNAFFIAPNLNNGQGNLFLAHHLNDLHQFIQVQRGIFFCFIFKEIKKGRQHLHLPMVVCRLHDQAQHSGIADEPFQQLLKGDVVDHADKALNEFSGIGQFIRNIFFEKASCNGIGLDVDDVPES